VQGLHTTLVHRPTGPVLSSRVLNSSKQLKPSRLQRRLSQRLLRRLSSSSRSMTSWRVSRSLTKLAAVFAWGTRPDADDCRSLDGRRAVLTVDFEAGLESHRTRVDGTRVRIYALRSSETSHGRGVPIRPARPDSTAAEKNVGPENGTSHSSRGDNHSAPTDPAVPTD